VIRLLVDQNFNDHILAGLTRREPGLDVVHVRDVGLAAALDPRILQWAADHDRVLLTHDRRTIPPFLHDRIAAGLLVPGVFLVSDAMPIGQAIDELQIAVSCLSPGECADIVRYFPL